MDKPDNNFWNESNQKKQNTKKYLSIFVVILFISVVAIVDYKYEKALKTSTKPTPSEIKIVETPDKPTQVQCSSPDINGGNIANLINQFRNDNIKPVLTQKETFTSYSQQVAEEFSSTGQTTDDLKNTKTGDFWQWQNKNIKSDAKISISEYSPYSFNNKNNNNVCDIVEAFKTSTKTKDELLSDNYDLLSVGIKDSFILIIFAKTGKNTPQATASNQNTVPAPINPAPVDKSPKESQHILTFDYFNYRCYDSINGDRNYEIVRAVTEGMGSIWEVNDNRDFLCSNSNSEYYLDSVHRSSVYGSLYGSKNIYFKPFFKYPPDYADGPDGDQISIRYDLNKTKIESITYFGY